MSKQVMDRIEYLVLLVVEFAAHNRVSEAKAYRYLNQYGALALCDKHYNVMHRNEQGTDTVHAQYSRAFWLPIIFPDLWQK